MKRFAAILAASAALTCARAESEQSLGDFSREIRAKVSAKVSEVLSPRGRPAEIDGIVTGGRVAQRGG